MKKQKGATTCVKLSLTMCNGGRTKYTLLADTVTRDNELANINRTYQDQIDSQLIDGTTGDALPPVPHHGTYQ